MKRENKYIKYVRKRNLVLNVEQKMQSTAIIFIDKTKQYKLKRRRANQHEANNVSEADRWGNSLNGKLEHLFNC